MAIHKKKVLKIFLWVLLLLGLAFGVFVGYAYYTVNYKYLPSGEPFTHRVAYIDPATALGPKDFKACNENRIYDYYNPDRARYSAGKNGLRKFILANYENRGYTDSGYLNIRFVINCKGEAGRYIIIENDLNLEPAKFSEDLKNQLFDLTLQLKKWRPNVIRGEKADSYIYISYRIVHGEITEILP